MEAEYTTKETADILKVSTNTLKKWRSMGKGPEYVKRGNGKNSIRYRQSELEKYMGLA